MSPCMHQCGLGCAMRWAQEKGNCPLCRTVTRKIVVSALADNDGFTFEIEGATESSAEASEASDNEAFVGSDVSDDDSLMSDDLSPTEAAAEESEEAEEEGSARLCPGGFPLEAWAEFFNRHPDNIRPLLPWLRRELQWIYGWQWWEAAVVETSVLVNLCLWGPDEELLVRQLQHSLQEETSTFVQRLVAAAVNLCRDGILQRGQQQDLHTTGGDDNSPEASSSSTASQEGTPSSSWTSSRSPASSAEEDEDGLSAAAEQEQPQEGTEEAAVPGHSAPGQGRDRSPEQPRRPPKRRASSPQDGPPPHKRLP